MLLNMHALYLGLGSPSLLYCHTSAPLFEQCLAGVIVLSYVFVYVFTQCPFLHPADSPYFTFTFHYEHYYHFNFRSGFHMSENKWCLLFFFEFGLSRSTRWSPVPSIYLQTAYFQTFLWLNNTPRCIYTTFSLSIHQLLGT
jgi:hypothetical protein